MKQNFTCDHLSLGLYLSGSGGPVAEEVGSLNSISAGTKRRSKRVADSSYSMPSHSSYTLHTQQDRGSDCSLPNLASYLFLKPTYRFKPFNFD